MSREVSTKLDFGEESSPVITNSSKEDDDVEVKHTIVVSTKLKNNNRRAGLRGNGKDFHYVFLIYEQIKMYLRGFNFYHFSTEL